MNKLLASGIFAIVLFAVPVFGQGNFAFASETEGTIDTTNKYAWGENLGWLNFGCDGCDVVITDDTITGYAWSKQFGWINLNPTTSGVLNDGEGTLSGYAWGSNVGWINFTGVTINSSGEFLGYATVDLDGAQINFNCATGATCASADWKVSTDWRPASGRTPASSGGSSGSVARPKPPIEIIVPPPFSPINYVPASPVVDNVANVWQATRDLFSLIWGGPRTPPAPLVVEIPKETPFAFSSRWNLLPEREINAFVFAPLPYEIRILASKFPELDKTLKEVGIEKFSDMDKLTGVTLNIPGLADILNSTIKTVGLENLGDIENIDGVAIDLPGLGGPSGELKNNIGTGNIALIPGLPVAKFSPTAKKNLPAEFVFARASGELVDLGVALSVGNRGEVTQRISSLPGKTLKLVVKPISPARNVTGYIVFNAPTPKVVENSIWRSSLTASALFSLNGLVDTVDEPVPIERELVLSSFEYTDEDKDGIYTAEVTTPIVPGEYEIVTVIDYVDPVLGTRRMSMVTVIDPEGYIFEERDGKETRIPSAIVSLYRLNTATKEYELWKAEDYSQENPQITDVRGTYSFLVPEGSYYFHVEAPGYESYAGKAFLVREGNGIHENIELHSGASILEAVDWQTALLIVVILLLVYNLVRGRARDRVASP